MNTYVDLLLKRYRRKGVLIDTNLLLLLLVGSYNTQLLGERGFKRVAQFTVEDFDLLLKLVAWFETVVTTPHILTEVSNLAGQLAENNKLGCFRTFESTFKLFTELSHPSLPIFRQQHFPFIGLTDSVIVESTGDYLILTDDLRLAGRLENMGRDSLNFNHIRTQFWE